MINLSKYIRNLYHTLHDKLLQHISDTEVDSGLVAWNDFLRLENLILKGYLLKDQKKIRLNSEEKSMLACGATKILGRSKNRLSMLKPDQIIKSAKRKAGEKYSALGMPATVTSSRPKKKPVNIKIKNAILNDIINAYPKWDKMQVCEEMRKYFPNTPRYRLYDMIYETGMWIKPEKEYGKQWFDYMNQNGKVTWAADFFSVEVWTDHGLRTFHTLFFVNLTTQEVFIAGTTEYCSSEWLERTLNWCIESGEIPFGTDACCLIRDRDKRYTEDVDKLFMKMGLQPKKTSPGSPIMNFPAESFVRRIKQECLSHYIFFSGPGLRATIDLYTKFYNNWRPISYYDGGYIKEDNTHWHSEGKIIKVTILPGILTYYYRDPNPRSSREEPPKDEQ